MAQLRAAVGLSFFVLIGDPLIVMGIMGVLGSRARTGFLAGLAVAQISVQSESTTEGDMIWKLDD